MLKRKSAESWQRFVSNYKNSKILTSGSEKAPGFLVTLLHIYKTEGFRTLYKGLGPTIIRCFPANGALFMAYEGTQKLLKDV
ncbi:hypothetical protein QZH41_017161 [Actinostola sp. cb2023]|nr:hypothetical protein QZH41_017161 [Actinostola sp. cb2023]